MGDADHGGEADEFDDEKGADGEEDSSCFAQNIVKYLCDGLGDWAGENLRRVTLFVVSVLIYLALQVRITYHDET